MIRVLIYNEYKHENTEEKVRAVYPEGIHTAIREFISKDEEMEVKTVTLYDSQCNLNDLNELITDELLSNTDVIIWWGHMAHNLVPDTVVERVKRAVLGGMGAIFLHSGHHSKPFKALMGTTCNVSWREDGDMCRLWVCDLSHPIVQGVGRYFEIEHEETYCEPFGVPEPEKLLLIGWYDGGEAFRSGCTWQRGQGKIFYFQPGHETYPTYYNADVQRIILNAVKWAAPTCKRDFELACPHIKKISSLHE